MAPTPLTHCFFASDLHGITRRYEKLFQRVEDECPRAVFLGGDLLPSGVAAWKGDDPHGDRFLAGFLAPGFRELRDRMGGSYPDVFLILGNDDPRDEEDRVREIAREGLWHYVHESRRTLDRFEVFGYAFVPPTPFLLKDWERYDVSRYLPPGAVSPEDGWRTVDAEEDWVRYGTISEDLASLTREADLSGAVFLFHTPPHDTLLDRAALDGKSVDRVPLDLNVGSIAVRRFIEARQPLVTLHGHIHESARLTGSWQDRIGSTHLFSAAHDGPELALIRFDLEELDGATRSLI